MYIITEERYFKGFMKTQKGKAVRYSSYNLKKDHRIYGYKTWHTASQMDVELFAKKSFSG